MTIPAVAQAGISRRRAFAILATAVSATIALNAGWCATPTLSPERFGAKGDGVTDDTDAFVALSAYLNANDGGVVDLRPGATYRIGRQRRARETYLVGTPILHAQNVSRLVVRMNGAVLKFNDGMKFGSFNPADGTPLAVKAPHLVRAHRADIGYAISAINVGFFSVSDGVIDCNSRMAIIGGLWGDTGRQCTHAGVAAFNCDHVEWNGIRVTDSCLDGLGYGYHGLTGKHSPKPFIVRDVTVDRVGRNGISLVGTNSALFERCTFQRSGEAPNQRLQSFSSAPASCFDVEAEEAECRNVIVRNCRLLSGKGSATAFVADSGPSSDILIEDTLLVGAVWTSKPRTVFRRCEIFGVFAKLSGGYADPGDNSKVTDCYVSDSPRSGPPIAAPHAIDLQGAGRGVSISGTTVDVSQTRLNLRGGILADVTINFATGTNRIGNKDYAVVTDGASLRDVQIIDRIPAPLRPRDAFYVTAPASATRTKIVSNQSKIMWNSWSTGSNGYAGEYRG